MRLRLHSVLLYNISSVVTWIFDFVWFSLRDKASLLYFFTFFRQCNFLSI